MGYVFFLIQLGVSTSDVACYIVVVLAHYFFLTAYLWGFLFAIEIIYIISVMYTINHRSRTKMIRYCWFSSPYGMIIYFLFPLLIIFVSNLIAFIVVIFKLSILAYQSRRVKTSHYEKVTLSIKMIFAFGLLWAYTILAVIFYADQALSCIAMFINGLKGVIVFVVFICNKPVLHALHNKLRGRPSRRSRRRVSSRSARTSSSYT